MAEAGSDRTWNLNFKTKRKSSRRFYVIINSFYSRFLCCNCVCTLIDFWHDKFFRSFQLEGKRTRYLGTLHTSFFKNTIFIIVVLFSFSFMFMRCEKLFEIDLRIPDRKIKLDFLLSSYCLEFFTSFVVLLKRVICIQLFHRCYK